MRPIGDIMKSYRWGVCDCGLLLFTPCISTACYGQNGVLQLYDLPVNTGGKCANPCKVKQVGIVMFLKLVVLNAMQMLQDGIFLHMMILICRS